MCTKIALFCAFANLGGPGGFLCIFFFFFFFFHLCTFGALFTNSAPKVHKCSKSAQVHKKAHVHQKCTKSEPVHKSALVHQNFTFWCNCALGCTGALLMHLFN